jgi:hypothetical protein
MIFHKTIIAQELPDFDKKISAFYNDNKVVSIAYTINLIPIATEPVNIPGFQQQQQRVTLNTTFAAFIAYQVEEAPGAPGAPGSILLKA